MKQILDEFHSHRVQRVAHAARKKQKIDLRVL